MKSRPPIVLLAAAALLANVPLFAQEQTVTYDFSTDTKPTFWDESSLSGEPEALLFASSFSGGQGGLSASKGNLYVRVHGVGDTQASAGKFAVAFKPSKPLDLKEVTFDIGFQNTGKGPHPAYTLNYQVGVKAGDADEILLPKVVKEQVPASTDSNYLGGSPDVNTPAQFDLTEFKGIDKDVAVTIYVFVTDVGGSLTPDQTARIDNLAITTTPR